MRSSLLINKKREAAAAQQLSRSILCIRELRSFLHLHTHIYIYIQLEGARERERDGAIRAPHEEYERARV